uniref:SH3 and multiple ankyrin repeat domains protein 3-like isoform X2 n=1 Tax=Myxine glutinosa TaxID=7769 RepID=UPI0035902E23
MSSEPASAEDLAMAVENGKSELCVQDRTVVLEKTEREGFGFVLRGAKGNFSKETFEPTKTFPALQYLEKVDKGGVAWRAGLRTGDFILEVNEKNVVHCGHKEVVSLIRDSTSRLVLRVVSVATPPSTRSRRKRKAPPAPPRRSPMTQLTQHSKSLSTDEMAELEKLDEILASAESSEGIDSESPMSVLPALRVVISSLRRAHSVQDFSSTDLSIPPPPGSPAPLFPTEGGDTPPPPPPDFTPPPTPREVAKMDFNVPPAPLTRNLPAVAPKPKTLPPSLTGRRIVPLAQKPVTPSPFAAAVKNRLGRPGATAGGTAAVSPPVSPPPVSPPPPSSLLHPVTGQPAAPGSPLALILAARHRVTARKTERVNSQSETKATRPRSFVPSRPAMAVGPQPFMSKASSIAPENAIKLDSSQQPQSTKEPASSPSSPEASTQLAATASGGSFMNKPVNEWSKEDVAEWLDSLLLGEHRKGFLENEIDGSHLPSLARNDLIELGIIRVGHRKTIEQALKELLGQ